MKLSKGLAVFAFAVASITPSVAAEQTQQPKRGFIHLLYHMPIKEQNPFAAHFPLSPKQQKECQEKGSAVNYMNYRIFCA